MAEKFKIGDMDMDYEKNKEALAIVKQMIADGQISQDVAEKYFPELAESEDEKTRKALIQLTYKVYANTDYLTCVEQEKMLAYLEKQRGQKPVEWSEEDERMRTETIIYLDNSKDIAAAKCRPYISKCINWLKSLRPQKQWKPSEEQIDAIRIAAEVGTANNSWAMNVLKGLLKELKTI